jgi:hypothetical protein
MSWAWTPSSAPAKMPTMVPVMGCFLTQVSFARSPVPRRSPTPQAGPAPVASQDATAHPSGLLIHEQLLFFGGDKKVLA